MGTSATSAWPASAALQPGQRARHGRARTRWRFDWAHQSGYPSGGWSPPRIVPAARATLRRRAVACTHADLRIRVPFVRTPLRGARLELRHARGLSRSARPATSRSCFRRSRRARVGGACPCCEPPRAAAGAAVAAAAAAAAVTERAMSARPPDLAAEMGRLHELRAGGFADAGGGGLGTDAGASSCSWPTRRGSTTTAWAGRSWAPPVSCWPTCWPRSGSSGARSTSRRSSSAGRPEPRSGARTEIATCRDKLERQAELVARASSPRSATSPRARSRAGRTASRNTHGQVRRAELALGPRGHAALPLYHPAAALHNARLLPAPSRPTSSASASCSAAAAVARPPAGPPAGGRSTPRRSR